MKHNFLILIFSILLQGCYATTQIKNPYGDGDAFHVQCGNQQVWCYKLAEEKCPNGYNILSEENDKNLVPLDFGSGTQYMTASKKL